MNQRDPSSPVVMHYCHDTYGLGHLSRTRSLARQLRRQRPDITQLIVTGSPVAQDMLDGGDAEGADYIKLPSVVKVGSERYAARSMATSFAAVRDMRGDILASAVRHMRPDVFLVDHAPAGLKGEALPALRYLAARRPSARLVLGLRDIVDDPATVRAAWQAAGIYDLLDRVYDRILVYGQRDVFDVARAYRLSDRAASKLRYVGYLGHRPEIGAEIGTDVAYTVDATGLVGAVGAAGSVDAAGATLAWSTIPTGAPLGIPADAGTAARRPRPLVVVTAGGGGDGYPLLSTLLEGLRERGSAPDFDCHLVTGPLMSAAERASLARAADGLAGVALSTFAPGLGASLAAADAVVAMGGYNTVCEILASRRPALIVPRVHPRREQIIRARLLERRGLVDVLHPDDLDPERLVAAIGDLLGRPARSAGRGVDLDGVRGAALEIESLIDDPARMMVEAGGRAGVWIGRLRSLAAMAAL